MPKLRDKAQNVVEYGLLIGSIVLVVLLGVAKFGNLIEPWFAALAGSSSPWARNAATTRVLALLAVL